MRWKRTHFFAELLGVHLDLEQHQTRITKSRFWKVPLGLKALLRQKSCTRECSEVIIGHCTFLALVQRAARAALHDVCCLIRKSYRTRTKMWPSVHRELDFFCGLLLLLREEAWGLVTSTWNSGEVRQACGVRDKKTLSSCQRNTSPLTSRSGLSGFKWLVTR